MNEHLDPSRIEVLDDDMVEVLRNKTPVERVAIVLILKRLAQSKPSEGAKQDAQD